MKAFVLLCLNKLREAQFFKEKKILFDFVSLLVDGFHLKDCFVFRLVAKLVFFF